MKLALFLLAIPFSAVLSGCTYLTVDKVGSNSNPDGVRFALPEPIIVFSPKADGSVDVSTEYVPDSSNTFAIDSVVIIASGTTDVTVENGLLKTVSWKGDATAVANQLTQTAGNLAKGVADAQTARATAAAGAAKAEQQALAKLQEDLLAAEAKLATLRAEGASAATIASAAAEVAALRARLSARTSGLAPQDLAGNDPNNDDANAEGNDSDRSKYERVWGPAFFRVEDDGGQNVQLVAIDWLPNRDEVQPQLLFETIRPPKAGAKSLFPTGTIPADRPAAGKLRRFTLSSDGPLASVTIDRIRGVRPQRTIDDPTTAVAVSLQTPNVVMVTVRNDVADGVYELWLNAVRPDGTPLETHEIRFILE